MTRPIVDRMHEGLQLLAAHWSGRRRPKAFYLGPADWEDFCATDPPIIPTIWNNTEVHEESFEGVPVRPSKNVAPRASRIYDHTGTSRMLPE